MSRRRSLGALSDQHALLYSGYEQPLVPAQPEFGRRAPGDTAKFVGPKVPAWVTDAEKWQTLSRAERRALERHHRKVSRK